tara:strand:- start:10 stop:963 length:954 start_codon:yes stop_codon:yes gene_type:complete
MIEIDDRVVMLLFILFLGYMLFNRREGFNVGGQENEEKFGACKCKYPYTYNNTCLNEKPDQNGDFTNNLMEFWPGSCTDIKDKDSCNALKVRNNPVCVWDESEYKFNNGICECKNFNNKGECDIGGSIEIGFKGWGLTTDCTNITNPSECYAKSAAIQPNRHVDSDHGHDFSYVVSNYCKWNDNPTVTCDCKNASGNICLPSPERPRTQLWSAETLRDDCTSQTTLKGCTNMKNTGPGTHGYSEKMCKVTDISNTACNYIKDKNSCNKKLDDNNNKSCSWCTSGVDPPACNTIEQAENLQAAAPEDFKCSNLDNTAN